jgi:hypothetical protein
LSGCNYTTAECKNVSKRLLPDKIIFVPYDSNPKCDSPGKELFFISQKGGFLTEQADYFNKWDDGIGLKVESSGANKPYWVKQRNIYSVFASTSEDLVSLGMISLNCGKEVGESKELLYGNINLKLIYPEQVVYRKSDGVILGKNSFTYKLKKKVNGMKLGVLEFGLGEATISSCDINALEFWDFKEEISPRIKNDLLELIIQGSLIGVNKTQMSLIFFKFDNASEPNRKALPFKYQGNIIISIKDTYNNKEEHSWVSFEGSIEFPNNNYISLASIDIKEGHKYLVEVYNTKETIDYAKLDEFSKNSTLIARKAYP